MRVRCVSTYVTEEQRAALGRRAYRGAEASGLTVGSEYLVLGLAFEFDADRTTTGPYVLVLDDYGIPKSHDLSLFEVCDSRVSHYWHVRSSRFDSRQIEELMPPELFDILDAADDSARSLDEQDAAFFAALRSPEFVALCTLLRHEFNADDNRLQLPDT